MALPFGLGFLTLHKLKGHDGWFVTCEACNLKNRDLHCDNMEQAQEEAIVLVSSELENLGEKLMDTGSMLITRRGTLYVVE